MLKISTACRSFLSLTRHPKPRFRRQNLQAVFVSVFREGWFLEPEIELGEGLNVKGLRTRYRDGNPHRQRGPLPNLHRCPGSQVHNVKSPNGGIVYSPMI